MKKLALASSAEYNTSLVLQVMYTTQKVPGDSTQEMGG